MFASSSCNACPPPDTTNQCTDGPIPGPKMSWEIPNFCIIALGFSGTRSQLCADMGDDEWIKDGDGVGGSCNYIKHEVTECCNGCTFSGGCTIGGFGGVCKRKAYRGDDATCCLRDYNFVAKASGEVNFCFQDSTRQRTCDPNYRDVTNNNCQNTLLDYCVGADLPSNDTSWLNRWQPDSQARNNCSYAISRNLYGAPLPMFDNILQYAPEAYVSNEGLQFSRELMQGVFEKYRAQGFQIGATPGLPGYNSFQDVILKPLCTTAPGICQQGLTSTCSGTTTNDLLRNPALVPWCGCYMPPDQYQQYVDQYQVDKQCTPMCARQGNIPVTSADGRQTVQCNQNVCIIDDVTISLEQTDVGGGINFSQFCGGCSAPVSGLNNENAGTGSQQASSCMCIISDGTIAAASTDIGGGINLSESCGSNPQCYKQNPNPGDGNPDQLPIDCDGPANQNPYADLNVVPEGSNFQTWVIIFLILFGIFIVILVMLYLSRHGLDTDDKIIPRVEKSSVTIPKGQYSDPTASNHSIYDTSNRHSEFKSIYDVPTGMGASNIKGSSIYDSTYD